MIRVLVAEDELPLLKSTCTMIEKQNKNFKVVQRAANGKEAINALLTDCIDFLVLDVQMPVMNGVDVLKEMKKRNIKVPTIILSGFQDFKYVREAVRFGAIDYLLKPLKRKELSNVLKQVENKVWKKRSIERPKSNSFDRNQKYEISLLVFGSFYLLLEEYDLKEEQKNIDKYLQDAIEEINQEYIWIIPGSYPNERLIVIQKFKNRGEKIIQNIYENFLKFTLPVTIIFSDKPQTHTSIYKTSRNLRHKMKQVMLLNQSVLCLNDEVSDVNEAQNQIEYAKNQFLKVRMPEQIMDVLKIVLKNILHRSVIIEILKVGFLRFSDIMDCRSSYLEMEDEIFAIVQNSYSKEQLLNKLKKMIVYTFFNDDKRNGKIKLALEIKDFLDKNYHKTIGNQELSDIYGFVPAYLRDIFREQYALSPMEYLQNIKMERSKTLLIEQSSLPIKEIAEAVGFQDALYYSKVFRNRFMMSPSRYRRQEIEKRAKCE